MGRFGGVSLPVAKAEGVGSGGFSVGGAEGGYDAACF